MRGIDVRTTEVVTPTRGPGVRAMVLTVTLGLSTAMLARPAMFGLTLVPTVGLTRGVTVGLIVVTRESMWRLGVRIMLCASAAEPPKAANGKTAADNANARRCVLVRQLTPSWSIKPRLTLDRCAGARALTASPPHH